MNPNASNFVPMSASAPAFVPGAFSAQPPVTPADQGESWESMADSTGKDTADAAPKASITKTPPAKTESKPKAQPEENKQEKKDKKKATPKKDYEPTQEELQKELERIAKEEGVTTEDLLKEEKEEVPVEVVDEETKEHVNVVFIGHVDAGKSTLSGQILLQTGQVDERTIQKYEKEAKEKNRESWWIAYIMDTNEEERAKGKTVEVGRANFETEQKRYTILDAPGHKNYVPNMIGGASQADIGILVISARKGEFETGFNRGGQTREHAMLAKTLGVKSLVIVVNKMDDHTVEWKKERFDEIVNALTPFMKQTGYNPKTDVTFVPIAAVKGLNIKNKLPDGVCSWYDGPSLIGVLDSLKQLNRDPLAPLRIPVMDRHRDAGKVWVLGKVESGTVSKGKKYIVNPGKYTVECTEIHTDFRVLNNAKVGENVRIALKGIDEENIHSGFVVSSIKDVVPCQNKFVAQLAVIDLLPHNPIFTTGYKAVCHIHTAIEECSVIVLLSSIDKKTGKVVQKKPRYVKTGALVNCIIETARPICFDLFSKLPQIGRFTLRDEGITIAVGKITSLGPKKDKN